MTRPDDSTLDPDNLRAVEEQAHRLLDRADAWDRYPAPVDDILAAAKVRLAPTSAFDPAAIISYLRGKTAIAQSRIKSAITKIFGIYDASEALIHVDNTVVEARQTFVTLHETGHHDIPWHRKIFRLSLLHNYCGSGGRGQPFGSGRVPSPVPAGALGVPIGRSVAECRSCWLQGRHPHTAGRAVPSGAASEASGAAWAGGVRW